MALMVNLIEWIRGRLPHVAEGILVRGVGYRTQAARWDDALTSWLLLAALLKVLGARRDL
jgi:hypothetical protein